MASSPGENRFVEVDLLDSDISESVEGSVHSMLEVQSVEKKEASRCEQQAQSLHYNDAASSGSVSCSLLNSSATEHVNSGLTVENATSLYGDSSSTKLFESSCRDFDSDSDSDSLVVHDDSTEPGNFSLEMYKDSNSDSVPHTSANQHVGCHDPGECVNSERKCSCGSAVVGNEDLLMTIHQLKKRVRQLSKIELSLRAELLAASDDRSKFKLQNGECGNKGSDHRVESICEEDVTALQEHIAQLNGQIQQHQFQWKAAHEKWVAQDAVIKNTISQLTKSRDECRRDKENMVMKYALAEQKNIEQTEKIRKLETTIAEMSAEKDNVMTYLTTLRSDKQKIKEIHDKKAAEVLSLKLDLEKMKESVVAQELKTKWYQNQLTIETESHQATREKLSELETKFKQLYDENERVQLEKQATLKTCQESLVMKSITSELVLKETKHALETHKQEQNDQQELYVLLRQELDTLKPKQKELVEELNTYKDKVKCLNDERLHQEQTLAGLSDTIHKQKLENQQLAMKLSELELIEETLSRYTEQLKELEALNHDLSNDISASSDREAAHLAYIANLSDQVTKLQLENTELHSQVHQMNEDDVNLSKRCVELSERLGEETRQLEELRRLTSVEIDVLKQQLAVASELAVERLRCLEDKDDELKTLKRRHAASSKEINRQLSQLQRQVEQVNFKEKSSSTSSPRSVTREVLKSEQTLHKIVENTNGRNVADLSSEHDSETQSVDSASVSDVEGDGSCGESKMNTQRLIAKIVQLQTTNISLTNKLEFIQEHTRQLTEELRSKSRIIQDYVLREETYGLRPTAPVKQKSKSTAVTKKSLLAAILPSDDSSGVYTKQFAGRGEHLVNQQLQSALEDTLLKNLQYKENAERLAGEVTRLDHQNKELKLQLEDATRLSRQNELNLHFEVGGESTNCSVPQ